MFSNAEHIRVAPDQHEDFALPMPCRFRGRELSWGGLFIDMRYADISGIKFGRFTPIRYVHAAGRKSKWLCRCDCGAEKLVSPKSLKCGEIKSCGCLFREIAGKHLVTHGRSKTREYRVWIDMRNRCYVSANKWYKNYGARGIVVCDRWLNSFENFLEDMGLRPSKGASIERIDNDGNYEPSNCKWGTFEEQCNNKRTSRKITYDGRCMTVSQWSKETGISKMTLVSRLNRNWSTDKALNCQPGKAHCYSRVKQQTRPLSWKEVEA